MSVIKGFQSRFKGLTSLFNGAMKRLPEVYTTLSGLGDDKFALDVLPYWLTEVGTGTLDATGHRKNVIAEAGHSLQEGNIIRFTAGANSGKIVQVVDVSANEILLNTSLSGVAADTYTYYRSIIPVADSNGNLQVVPGALTVIDRIDDNAQITDGLMIPTGVQTIPRQTSNALQIVASLAAPARKVQAIHDIGFPTNLYLDAARTQFICHLPLTPDESVDVNIPAGSTIFIGAGRDTDIDDTNSFIELNFIG